MQRSSGFAILAAIALICVAPAEAAEVGGTATLAAPTAKPRIVTPGGVWYCEGTACTGPSEAARSPAVAACTVLADDAGRVTAFSAGALGFGEAELKRCNRHRKDGA